MTTNQNPKHILFTRGYSFDDRPLFKSQKELADIIFTKYPDDYATKTSLITFLNKVLQGGRPLSEKLKKAISYALDDRIVDEGNRERVKRELFKAFQEHNSRNKLKAHSNSEESRYAVWKREFNELIDKPGHHVFISNHLLELLNTEEAKQHIEKILQNIGIVKKDGEKVNKGFKYQYFVKDLTTSTSLWKNLYAYLRDVRSFTHDEAQNALIEANKNYYIRVFSSQPYFAINNLYLYNIRREDPQAYRTYLINKTLQICKVPDLALEPILTELYLPLKGILKNRMELVIEDKYGYPTETGIASQQYTNIAAAR